MFCAFKKLPTLGADFAIKKLGLGLPSGRFSNKQTILWTSKWSV